MLSGGSQWSSAVTNSSKYRHVFRDSFSRKCCWLSESCSAELANRPAQPPGDQRRSHPGGEPGPREEQHLRDGKRRARSSAAAASAGAKAIARNVSSRLPSAPRSESLAVFHSSSRRLVQPMRTSVRTIASSADVGFVGQEDERQHAVGQRPSQGLQRHAQVHAQRQVHRLAKQVRRRAEQRRQQDHARPRTTARPPRSPAK